ncbi:hypothetical protein [Pseudomonas japonica]|uniref:hypothetical protein n=1 Tax=Pseudomonas japonica TaxID=256466 RepID=UPI003A84EC0C
MYYYSPSKNGLFVSAVHGSRIPEDSIELTSEQYSRLKGQQLYLNEAGVPDIRIDDLDVSETERRWRDAELVRVAWVRDRHRDEVDLQLPTTITAEQFIELLGYMQRLRDWPESEHFPDQAYRPAPLSWLV